MYADEMNAKLNMGQMRTAQGIGQAPSAGMNYDNVIAQANTLYRPPTLREEAEKQIGYHRDQADKADRAVAFLRENPAFDEFVRLVRAGVIQF
jgi:hypothetical protein